MIDPEDAGARLGCVAKLMFLAFALLVLVAAASAQDKTSYFQAVTIEQSSYEGSITCIFCDVVVRGDVHGDVVAIWGSVTVYGKVRKDLVTVGGKIRFMNGAEADGDVVGIGGPIISEGATMPPGKGFVSFPWIHLPGQRSAGWRGVVALFGFNLVCAFLPTLIMRPRAVRSVAKASQRWMITSVVGILFIVVYSYGLDALDEYLHSSDLVESIFALIFLAILGIGIAGIAYAIGDRLFPSQLLASLAAGAVVLTALELIPYAGFVAMILAACWATGAALWSGLGFRGPRPPKAPKPFTELKLVR